MNGECYSYKGLTVGWFKKKSTANFEQSSQQTVEVNYNGSQLVVAQENSKSECSNDFGLSIASFSSGGSSSYISTRQAMNLETVFTCIRDKSETVGRLPLKLYRRIDDMTRERITKGREFRIWTQKPNDYMGMINFLEFMVFSVETGGVFYAYKNRNTRGAVMELVPFRYQQNITANMDLNGNVYYTYTMNDGKPDMSFGNDELLIVKLTTVDGFTPISPLSYNAAMLNGTAGADNTWNNLHTDGISSQVYLTTEQTLDPNAAERLKKQWDNYRGPAGVRKTPVLENGLEVKPFKIPPKDMELLKSREYTVNRICQIFRVPPQRVGMPGSQSNQDGMLEIDEYYMRNGIEPILRKFEESVNNAFSDAGNRLEIEFDRRAFYSGSPKTLVEISERELKGGMATVNEVRLDNQRDPVPGGDVFVVDNNNCVYGTWDELPEIREQVYNRELGESDAQE